MNEPTTMELCTRCGEDESAYQHIPHYSGTYEDCPNCHAFVPPAPTGEAQPVTQEERADYLSGIALGLLTACGLIEDGSWRAPEITDVLRDYAAGLSKIAERMRKSRTPAPAPEPVPHAWIDAAAAAYADAAWGPAGTEREKLPTRELFARIVRQFATTAPAPEWVGEYRRELERERDRAAALVDQSAYWLGVDAAILLLDRLAPSSPAQKEGKNDDAR